MSSLIVHTKNYPHRAVIDSQKAAHLKAGIYTGILVHQHDVRTNAVIAVFEAELEYAIKSMEAGFGTMDGTFLIRLRPVSITTTMPAATDALLQSVVVNAPKQRKPRAKKQFCVGLHDTFVVGRNISGVCNECAKLHNNVSNAKKRLETAMKKVARSTQLQGLNPDEPAE